jgi:hypothetical protein
MNHGKAFDNKIQRSTYMEEIVQYGTVESIEGGGIASHIDSRKTETGTKRACWGVKDIKKGENQGGILSRNIAQNST